MGWNNRIININGRGLRMLERAIELACDCGETVTAAGTKVDHRSQQITGSLVDPDCGLIWLWTSCTGSTNYPAPLTPRQVAEISLRWLESDTARAMKCEEWDANADHDGENSRGWRVYTEEWGHVGKADWAAIFAVRPVFLWHGK